MHPYDQYPPHGPGGGYRQHGQNDGNVGPSPQQHVHAQGRIAPPPVPQPVAISAFDKWKRPLKVMAWVVGILLGCVAFFSIIAFGLHFLATILGVLGTATSAIFSNIVMLPFSGGPTGLAALAMIIIGVVAAIKVSRRRR